MDHRLLWVFCDLFENLLHVLGIAQMELAPFVLEDALRKIFKRNIALTLDFLYYLLGPVEFLVEIDDVNIGTPR